MEKARRSRSLLHSSTKASFHAHAVSFFALLLFTHKLCNFKPFELCAVNDAHVVAMSKCTGRRHSALLRQKKRRKENSKKKKNSRVLAFAKFFRKVLSNVFLQWASIIKPPPEYLTAVLPLIDICPSTAHMVFTAPVFLVNQGLIPPTPSYPRLSIKSAGPAPRTARSPAPARRVKNAAEAAVGERE